MFAVEKTIEIMISHLPTDLNEPVKLQYFYCPSHLTLSISGFVGEIYFGRVRHLITVCVAAQSKIYSGWAAFQETEPLPVEVGVVNGKKSLFPQVSDLKGLVPIGHIFFSLFRPYPVYRRHDLTLLIPGHICPVADTHVLRSKHTRRKIGFGTNLPYRIRHEHIFSPCNPKVKIFLIYPGF
jgi:hypothetical protein